MLIHLVLEAKSRHTALRCSDIWLPSSASCPHTSKPGYRWDFLSSLNYSMGQVISDRTSPFLDTGGALGSQDRDSGTLAGQTGLNTSDFWHLAAKASSRPGPAEEAMFEARRQGLMCPLVPYPTSWNSSISSPFLHQNKGVSVSCTALVSPMQLSLGTI